MKKLLIVFVTTFAFIGAAHAVVNINTATQAELQTLPGIDAAKAKKIIDYRSKAGAFRSTDDLEKADDSIDMRNVRKEISITGATLIRPETKPAAK